MELLFFFRKSENKFEKLALAAVAVGVLTLGSVDPASAAKTGGRIGGQAFRPSSPPRSSSPRINNSRLISLFFGAKDVFVTVKDMIK